MNLLSFFWVINSLQKLKLLLRSWNLSILKDELLFKYILFSWLINPFEILEFPKKYCLKLILELSFITILNFVLERQLSDETIFMKFKFLLILVFELTLTSTELVKKEEFRDEK